MRTFHYFLLMYVNWCSDSHSRYALPRANHGEALGRNTAALSRVGNHVEELHRLPANLIQEQRTSQVNLRPDPTFIYELFNKLDLFKPRPDRHQSSSSKSAVTANHVEAVSLQRDRDDGPRPAANEEAFLLGKLARHYGLRKRQLDTVTVTSTAASTTATSSGGSGNNDGNNSGPCSGNGDGGGTDNGDNCSSTTNNGTSSPSGGGLTRDNKIAIGSAVGAGCLTIIGLVMTYITCRRGRKKKTAKKNANKRQNDDSDSSGHEMSGGVVAEDA